MASNSAGQVHGQASGTERAATPSRQRVPTINDLRVKQCYICMEEERSDSGNPNAARRWTHPCSCTLVAHSDCLLTWIQSSQATSSRAPNALKCPQCGTAYELISKEPYLLKLLGSGNKLLQKCGTWFTLLGVATAVGVAGTSIYICLTAYGAYALERFIGREMFDLILTDDPTNWPWSAYINLPLIPLSLILSRFSPTSSLASSSGASASSFVIPLLLVWPPAQPVGEPARRLYEYWSRPDNARRLTELKLFGSTGTMMKMWPPPPVLFGLFGVPIVKALYRKVYARIYKRVLGTSIPAPINRRANPPPAAGNANAGGDEEEAMRIEEGPILIRVLRERDAAAGPGEANGPAAQDPPAADDPNAANVQAAENYLAINAGSLGRRVGGALLIPAISNFMGSLLLRLSRRNSLLRGILGVSQHRAQVGAGSSIRNWLLGDYTGPGSGSSAERAVPRSAFAQPRTSPLTASEPEYPYPPLSWTRLFLFSPPFGTTTGPRASKWNDLSFFQQTRVGLKLVFNAMLGGSRMWVESDPVWWRNTLGFALFCTIKDALHLLHLYLKKKELESRKVLDRDFSAVDISSLDLLPGFLRRDGTTRTDLNVSESERHQESNPPASGSKLDAQIQVDTRDRHEGEVDVDGEIVVANPNEAVRERVGHV